VFLGGGGPGLSSRPFAEKTQATIDEEVARLLREAEQSAVALIHAHRAELGQLVELLLEKETVDGEAGYQIVGKPVYPGTGARSWRLPHLPGQGPGLRPRTDQARRGTQIRSVGPGPAPRPPRQDEP
jgi:hypothetical protein